MAIVTATRAEYGLLTPLIRLLDKDVDLKLDLIVTGGHLSEKQGMTITEIQKDGFRISHKIPILEDGDTPYDCALTISNAIKSFASCFRNDRPDMLVILGDRTEMLGVAFAAINEGIPIAHINGGDVTEGAIDDCVRHALTKMSFLHFTTCESYRKRVIQLGEAPDRVFNVGSLSVENIKHEQLMSREELSRSIGFDLSDRYAVLTYHPVTLEGHSAETDIDVLFEALEEFSDLKLLITKANADSGGMRINERIDEYAAGHEEHMHAVFSLGKTRYLSALKFASVVIGNSSSGIMETPSFGVPTVNIGDRQKGRIQAENVINCQLNRSAIVDAVQTALSDRFRSLAENAVNPYGDGHTSEKIVFELKRYFESNHGGLKKGFYDI